MTTSSASAPVVVGIDGSQAAIVAALWAAAEAANRGVVLRLVHVIDTEGVTERGLKSLADACRAVQEIGTSISIETQIRWGAVGSTLIDESRGATMTCVGSNGIAPIRQRLGSTAATLAAAAHSPVAVIRAPGPVTTAAPNWIVTVVDDTEGSDAVVDFALGEAQLRGAPVLALSVPRPDHGLNYDELERQVATWRIRKPGVHIHPFAVPTDIAKFLEHHDELSVQLAVVGVADAERTRSIVGPHGQSRRSQNHCSVLVVR